MESENEKFHCVCRPPCPCLPWRSCDRGRHRRLAVCGRLGQGRLLKREDKGEKGREGGHNGISRSSACLWPRFCLGSRNAKRSVNPCGRGKCPWVATRRPQGGAWLGGGPSAVASVWPSPVARPGDLPCGSNPPSVARTSGKGCGRRAGSASFGCRASRGVGAARRRFGPKGPFVGKAVGSKARASAGMGVRSVFVKSAPIGSACLDGWVGRRGTAGSREGRGTDMMAFVRTSMGPSKQACRPYWPYFDSHSLMACNASTTVSACLISIPGMTCLGMLPRGMMAFVNPSLADSLSLSNPF